MKELQFRQAMGEIRDEYLEEAMAYQSPKKSHGWVKWGGLAACVAAAVAVGVLWVGQRQDTQTADHPEHPVPELCQAGRPGNHANRTG